MQYTMTLLNSQRLNNCYLHPTSLKNPNCLYLFGVCGYLKLSLAHSYLWNPRFITNLCVRML